jgi:hypothetical protein
MADIAVAQHEQSAGEKENKTTEQPFEQPYPPSWIDRLIDWVQRLPGHGWLFYLGVALVLVLARTIAAWSDGSLPVGTLFPAHVVLAITGAYLLFVLHYLDDMAGAALSDFRPVLTVDDAGYERLRYEITTMPARPTLIWSLAGLVFGVAVPTLLLPESQLRAFKVFTSPAASVVDYLLIVLGWMIGFIVLYHTIRQLGLVSRIYTQHTNVNIFDTGPLYGLSRVAAMTTIALLFITFSYVTLAANWQFDNPVIALTVGVSMVVALVTFVWPLFGAHRLLQQEKARWKGEVARQMEAVARELHHRVSTDDMHGMESIKDALESLIAERGVLDKVPTWPWEPETVRVVITALLLPVVLWIVTRVLERLAF